MVFTHLEVTLKNSSSIDFRIRHIEHSVVLLLKIITGIVECLTKLFNSQFKHRINGRIKTLSV